MTDTSPKLYPTIVLLILYYCITAGFMFTVFIPIISVVIVLGLWYYFKVQKVSPGIISEYQANTFRLNGVLFFLILVAIRHYHHLLLFFLNILNPSFLDGFETDLISWLMPASLIPLAAYILRKQVNVTC